MDDLVAALDALIAKARADRRESESWWYAYMLKRARFVRGRAAWKAGIR